MSSIGSQHHTILDHTIYQALMNMIRPSCEHFERRSFCLASQQLSYFMMRIRNKFLVCRSQVLVYDPPKVCLTWQGEKYPCVRWMKE